MPFPHYVALAKFEGKWKEKDFRTEREALRYANEQNLIVAKRRAQLAEIEHPTPPPIPAAKGENRLVGPLWTEAQLEGIDTAHDYDPMKGPPFRIYPCRQANYNFVVRGRIPGQKIQRKHFVHEREAKTYAHTLNTQAQNQGLESLTFPSWLRTAAQRCQQLLDPHKKTIEEAVLFYIAHLEREAKSCPIGELIPRFIESRKSAGVTQSYIKDLERRVKLFCDYVGAETSVSAITTQTIEAYFLSDPKFGPASRNHIRTLLWTFFGYAKAQKLCLENPVVATQKAKQVETPVGILTPEQLGKVLCNVGQELVPFIAIGAFAGLRVAELIRLDWAQVDLADGYIEVTAKNAKSARRRVVKILPALDAWIRPLAKLSGPIVPWARFLPSYRIGAAIVAAGLKEWPRNGLRHSYASYHIAHFKDAAALALEMGHTTTSLIFHHYRQVVREAQAEKYWNILPAGAENVVNFTSKTAQIASKTAQN
jgi:integrase